MEQGPLPSISSILSVPDDLIVKRVRNVREAELLRQTTATASRFESAVSTYEVLALKLAMLKEQWDAAWLSHEPQLAPSIPIIGQAMSEQNVARGRLIEQIEDLVSSLQQQGAALLQVADMHRSYARELTAEGLSKLAAEKMLLCTIEQELASRITTICSGGCLRALSPMSDFVRQLETPSGQPAAKSASPVAPQPGNEPGTLSSPESRPEKVQVAASKGPEDGEKENPGGEVSGNPERPASEDTRMRTGVDGDVPNGRNAENDEEANRGCKSEVAPKEAQLAAGASLEPPRETGSEAKEDESGPRVDEPGARSEAPRLGKRLREVSIEQGGAKAPRLNGDSDGQNPANSDWVEPLRTGQQLSAAAPFLSNLAAAFQLEEGLDDSGSKGTRGSDEARARDEAPDPSGVSQRVGCLDERVSSEGGSESLEAHRRGTPPEGRSSQDDKDPFLTPRERQLMTDEKLTPPSTSSPLTSTQSPRGPGESTPGSSNGPAGTGRQAAIDRGVSPGKWPLQDSGNQRSPSEKEAQLEKGERSGSRPGLEEGKVFGGESPQCPVEPVQAATPSATTRGESPSQTQSPSKSQGVLGGSQNTPRASASQEKLETHRDIFRSPSQGAAFKLRLSSSSSSPSKTPGSEKLSQTGGPSGQSRQEPSQIGGHSEIDPRSERVIPEGYRGRRLTLFDTNNEAEPSDLPSSEGPAEASGGHPVVAKPSAHGTEERVPRVANIAATSALTSPGVPEALPSLQQADETLADQRQEFRTADGAARSSGFPHQERELEGGEKHRPFSEEAFEPPSTYTGVWAHEPQWRETQSQAFTDRRSQSQTEARLGDHAADRDRVPDSEEGGSRSSQRGFHRGPPPPPSSPTSSPDDLLEMHGGMDLGAGAPPSGPTSSRDCLLERPRGDDPGTIVAAASPVSSIANPSGGGPEKVSGEERLQFANENKQATPAETQNCLPASSERSDASGSDSGATELVPETESMEEETEEQDAATRHQETAPVASPCRASESPAMIGSQPLSQSRVC